jgi:hypothetical protein
LDLAAGVDALKAAEKASLQHVLQDIIHTTRRGP